MSTMRLPDVIKLERQWHLGERIGKGGFARVYLARSEADAPAVVKLIPKAPGAQRELLFEDMDSQPNVVRVLDSGEWDDYWVLVMPLAEKSLRDHLDEMAGCLSVNDAIRVLVDIAEALVAIEGRIVHRDIKPENILLLDGHWCLADFGIARYAEATTAPDTLKYAMTRAYAAPEQWREERASSATDVYALGVVAYELLAGRRPFQGPDASDYRRQHLQELPRRLSGIPARLQALVEECLYKYSQARPVPQNLLTRLKGSMQAASPAASRLQEADTLAVERKAEEARKQSAAQSEAERRRELCQAADRSLERILTMLDQEIRSNAPSAQAATGPLMGMWSLNAATLRVERTIAVGLSSYEGMPFETMAYTTISLTVPRDRYGHAGRSHSLWYCDAQERGVFRWYEIAFMFTPGVAKSSSIDPFALAPGGRDGDAELALSTTTMHVYQVAWPFTPIDQGDEESFIERWIGWFALAAQR